VVLDSKLEANDRLRWFLREILYKKTWTQHPEYKVILGKIVAEDLRLHGFSWQASRLLNHLHLWMRSQKIDLSVRVKISNDLATAGAVDTSLSIERGGVS